MKGAISDRMKSYGPFVSDLSRLLVEGHAENECTTSSALNGQAYQALRKLVPIDERRSSGAFFTGPEVSEVLASLAKDRIRQLVRFIDPACGAGDLLLAGARHLPIRKTLDSTIASWGEYIYGFDRHPLFVEATKLRLMLLAQQRGKFQAATPDTDDVFPGIRCEDALAVRDIYSTASVVLLNPPYNCVPARPDCNWSRGKVSAAAIFMDHLVNHVAEDGRIYAILPEVLRCGSRYRKFRGEIGTKLDVISETSLGVFDKWTDIDVFVTEMHIASDARSRVANPAFQVRESGEATVGHGFKIRVGPVVAYRSPETGTKLDFLEAREATPWAKNFVCKAQRRFSGTTFRPPFVVIRRTSRPGDRFRAVGTIVRGKKPVAVENHLLIAIPKRGTVKECGQLLKVLRLQETNDHLDFGMRCRHLTVESVTNIPWNIR